MGGGVSSPATSKAHGDIAFKSARYDEALFHYTQAIVEHQDDKVEDNQMLAILYSNRSCVFELCNQAESALQDALKAISLHSVWPKAYFRAVKASMLAQRYDEADIFLEKARALSPSDPDLVKFAAIYEVEKQRKKIAQASGSLFTWGCGEAGQLGLGFTTNKSLPVVVDGLRGKYIHEVACGAIHTVALSTDGETYVWGDNNYSQLGLGNTSIITSALHPVLVPGLIGHHVTAISAGAAHTLALTKSGHVFGWGMANAGQLGLGSISEPLARAPLLIEALAGRVASIACGLAHSVFLLDDGTIEGCGLNSFGQLGLGPDVGELDPKGRRCVAAPTPITIIDDKTRVRGQTDRDGAWSVSHVACGGAHTLVIDTEGRLYACGSNSCGQLGLGSNDDTSTFQPVSVRDEGLLSCTVGTEKMDASRDHLLVAFAACGEEFSAVVTRAKAVYTFGLGICGQIGNNKLDNATTPQLVEGMEGKGAEVLSCSQGQVFALTASGAVFTWGLPGDRANAARFDDQAVVRVPEKVGTYGPHKAVRQILCGRKHFALLINAPYGPQCFVSKGLGSKGLIDPPSGDDILGEVGLSESGGDVGVAMGSGAACACVVQAGQKFAFRLVARDWQGRPCSSGGARVVARVEEIDAMAPSGPIRERAGAHPTQPVMAVDDNMDGTYSGSVKLFLSGFYFVSVTVDGLPVMQSPFEVKVVPGPPWPKNCVPWWGKYVSSMSVDSLGVGSTVATNPSPIPGPGLGPNVIARDGGVGGKQGDEGVSATRDATVPCIEAASGTFVLFTVSCKDRFGNRVIHVDDDTNRARDRGEGKSMGAAGDGSEHVLAPTTVVVVECRTLSSSEGVGIRLTHDEFTKASGGVIPCYFQCPLGPGIYQIHASLDVDGKLSSEDRVIQSCPMFLTVSPRVDAPPVECKPIEIEGSKEELNCEPSLIDVLLEEAKPERPQAGQLQEEQQENFLVLRRREMTRRRAEEALRQHHAAAAAERERRRRQQSVKRTGGGFIIQYSKDV